MIEKVPNEDTNTLSCDFHYLSHTAVMRNDHSTTKLRIVFDASVHHTTELCLRDILQTFVTLLT